MTLQQEACASILSMSDEGVAFINQVIKSMKPTFFVSNIQVDEKKRDTSKRIGIAEGQFTVPDDFDAYNDEIADMFEGVLS